MLELAPALGSVGEAGRRRGVSRPQFYEHERRFQEQGLDGLRGPPPIHRAHPQTPPPQAVERILALGLERPGWGCDELSDYLQPRGVSVSGPPIRGILAKQGRGRAPSTGACCGWRSGRWRTGWS